MLAPSGSRRRHLKRNVAQKKQHVADGISFLGGGGNQADGVHLALDLLQAFTTMAMDPYVAEDIARELSSSAVRGRLPSWLAPVPWTAR